MGVLSGAAQAAIAAARERLAVENSSTLSPLVLDRSNPKLTSLPAWFDSFRSHQIPAIEETLAAFERGADVVVLDAPTGSGKTMIAEAVRRLMGVDRALYVCTTKSLQDQFINAYRYAKVLKGRSNYPTQNFARDFHPENWLGHVSAADCTYSVTKSCALCVAKVMCPYECAKREAMKAQIAVLNSAYFLSECNYVGKFASRELVIVDEFDVMESVLMGFVTVDISEKKMVEYGWYPPDKVTVPASWLEWVGNVLPDVITRRTKITDVSNPKQLRAYKYLQGLEQKLTVLSKDLAAGEGSWIYTGQGNEGTGRKGTKNLGRAVSFRPAKVDGIGMDTLWRHGKKWLCMSGTPISAAARLQHLGFKGSWEVVKVANTFPKENRVVKYRPAADMAAKNKDVAWPKVLAKVNDICVSHANDRVLVHTVSYEMTKYLRAGFKGGSGRPVYSYLAAAERDSALARYSKQQCAVLFGPSLDRGIDLPGDLCRVQVIVKVPFPYLGDKQVRARTYMKGGQEWYVMQTIATIIQMCGRGVRSENDWCVTYVLDEQFKRLWSENRTLFAKWFSESIEWR